MIPKFKAFINATKQIEDVTLIHFDSRLIALAFAAFSLLLVMIGKIWGM